MEDQPLLEGYLAFENSDSLIGGYVMELLDNTRRPTDFKLVNACSVIEAKDLDQTILGLMARAGDDLAHPASCLTIELESCNQDCANAVAIALVGRKGRISFAHG